MKITLHDAGVPAWADLASPDLAASRRFYAGVFGWDPRLSPSSERPVWTAYIATDDADATAAKVEASGGKVLTVPIDVPGQGHTAVFMDPTGAVFGVWQKKDFPGAAATIEPGALSWIELRTRDTNAVVRFYQAVFGWRTEFLDLGEAGVHAVFHAGQRPVVGMAPQLDDRAPIKLPSHWVVYFASADNDTDVTAAKIQELGGSLIEPPTDIPGVGRFALASDPTGAPFAILARGTVA